MSPYYCIYGGCPLVSATVSCLAFPKRLDTFHNESVAPWIDTQIKKSQTRFLNLVESFASRFLTPPTRPEYPKRPESGRPWGVQNSQTVQSSPSVQSWTTLANDQIKSITQFIAHDQISACNPHKTSIVLSNCFLLIGGSVDKKIITNFRKNGTVLHV